MKLYSWEYPVDDRPGWYDRAVGRCLRLLADDPRVSDETLARAARAYETARP